MLGGKYRSAVCGNNFIAHGGCWIFNIRGFLDLNCCCDLQNIFFYHVYYENKWSLIILSYYLLDAESIFLLVSVVDVIIYPFIQACFCNHYKHLSSSSLKENKCTRSLYCVINPLHLNGKTLSHYLSALNGRMGKHCPAMPCHF